MLVCIPCVHCSKADMFELWSWCLCASQKSVGGGGGGGDRERERVVNKKERKSLYHTSAFLCLSHRLDKRVRPSLCSLLALNVPKGVLLEPTWPQTSHCLFARNSHAKGSDCVKRFQYTTLKINNKHQIKVLAHVVFPPVCEYIILVALTGFDFFTQKKRKKKMHKKIRHQKCLHLNVRVTNFAKFPFGISRDEASWVC